MKRKPTKPRPEPAGADATRSLLPMELQVGDRLTGAGLEWEVVTHPTVFQGGKGLRARIRRPGIPETERDMIWPAHVRVEIRRGSS